MAKSRSQPVNVAGALPLMNPLLKFLLWFWFFRSHSSKITLFLSSQV